MSLSRNKHRESSLHTPLPDNPVRVRSQQRAAPRSLIKQDPNNSIKATQSIVSPRDMVPHREIVMHSSERLPQQVLSKSPIPQPSSQKVLQHTPSQNSSQQVLQHAPSQHVLSQRIPSQRVSSQRILSQRIPPQHLVSHQTTDQYPVPQQSLSKIPLPQYAAPHHGPAPGSQNVLQVEQRNHINLGMSTQLQSSTLVITTPLGQFIIPNYDLMTAVEIAREKSSYNTKFMQINDDWKHLGVSFELPRKDEHISNIAIRYQETEKHLSTKTGSDFWFIILCVGWGIIQKVAAYYGLPADGYVESQIKNYKMYQSQLIRMGATSGFGTEWPPWMQVTVTSCANLVLIVILSKMCPGAKSYAPGIMREISSVITGNNTVEISSEGTPVPNSGGVVQMLSSALQGGNDGAGGISNLLGSVMGMFSGSDSKKKKRSKKAKTDAVDKRRSPSNISF